MCLLEIKESAGRPPDELPASGACNGIDSRLPVRNPDTPGRDLFPWVLLAWRAKALVQPPEIREAGSETYHVDVIEGGAMELDHLLDR